MTMLLVIVNLLKNKSNGKCNTAAACTYVCNKMLLYFHTWKLSMERKFRDFYNFIKTMKVFVWNGYEYKVACVECVVALQMQKVLYTRYKQKFWIWKGSRDCHKK